MESPIDPPTTTAMDSSLVNVFSRELIAELKKLQTLPAQVDKLQADVDKLQPLPTQVKELKTKLEKSKVELHMTMLDKLQADINKLKLLPAQVDKLQPLPTQVKELKAELEKSKRELHMTMLDTMRDRKTTVEAWYVNKPLRKTKHHAVLNNIFSSIFNSVAHRWR